MNTHTHTAGGAHAHIDHAYIHITITSNFQTTCPTTPHNHITSLEAHTHGRSVEIGGLFVTNGRSYIFPHNLSWQCVVFKQRRHNPLTTTESILIAIIITTEVDTDHT